jgi:hypothetical protein
MVIGVAFIAVVAAGVTGAVIQRDTASAEDAGRTRVSPDAQAIVEAFAQTREALTQLPRRLDEIDAKIPG